MILRDLLDLVGKEKRDKERAKAVGKFVIGIGAVAAVCVTIGILFTTKLEKKRRESLKKKGVNTIETIKDTIRKKAEALKDSGDDAEQEVCDIIKDGYEKTEGVKKDITDGSHEIIQDIHKTVENVSNELDRSVK